MFIFVSSAHKRLTLSESLITAVAPSLMFGELEVQLPSASSTEGNLVTTVKETITSPSYSRLIAELEKQYVAITPPDSPEPQSLVREMIGSNHVRSFSVCCQLLSSSL